jgi:hypothetical protein
VIHIEQIENGQQPGYKYAVSIDVGFRWCVLRDQRTDVAASISRTTTASLTEAKKCHAAASMPLLLLS